MKEKNVKKKYELFGTELTITGAHRQVASYYLKSWNTLWEYLDSDVCNEIDLMRMIVIEKEGKNRPQLISRMHSAITTIRRNSQRKELGIQDW